jgi:hypothetical protein
MADGLSAHLVDLQRSADVAWDAVEAHWRTADTARDADRRVPQPHHARPTEENAEHDRLMQAANDAQKTLRQALADAGLDRRSDVIQGLHLAARET